MISRRELLVVTVGGLGATAGCLDDDPAARCASRGEGSGSRHLRQVAPIRGDERVALGVSVSPRAVTEERFHAVRIRDADGTLVGSIPLANNRELSSLDPDEYGVFASGDGELYAVPLGPPPVHGEYTVSLVDPNDERIATARVRFNCYAQDGDLP